MPFVVQCSSIEPEQTCKRFLVFSKQSFDRKLTYSAAIANLLYFIY